MRVIKCTGKNRQAILNDAEPSERARLARYRPKFIDQYQNSDGSTYTKISQAPATSIADNLEYHIRKGNAYYTRQTPAEDGTAYDVAGFMYSELLFRDYNFHLPQKDVWFTALKKVIASTPGSATGK